MISLYDNIREGARKRALYNRTINELRSTSLETQLDLEIYYGDIPKIAHRAVYGA